MTRFFQVRVDDEELAKNFESKVFRLRKTKQEILLSLIKKWVENETI